MYLWFKFLHLFFLISWFAGLFYLPRIFVNLALSQNQPNNEADYARLMLMATKLYRFMTPLGLGALAFGLGMIHFQGWQIWIIGKVASGMLLVVYHVYCGKLLKNFARHTNQHSHRWYRVYNELPVLVMIVAVWLAVFKPTTW